MPALFCNFPVPSFSVFSFIFYILLIIYILQDIAGLAAVCKARGVPLLVDNAHGAYLHFLPGGSRHPIALGAAMCCDSGHKTLPVLTGGAYLHLGPDAPVQDSTAPADTLAADTTADAAVAPAAAQNMVQDAKPEVAATAAVSAAVLPQTGANWLAVVGSALSGLFLLAAGFVLDRKNRRMN